MPDKVVLAFSGGLDTSFCVKYLAEDKGLEVHTAIVDTGGFSADDLAHIANRAESLGVASHVVLDEIKPYYEQCLRYLLFGNVLKNDTYPLSVSAERTFQAMAIAQYAHKVGAKYIAHGSTGAGNDQVRFDLVFEVMAPGVEILTPIRDLKLSREAEIDYLKTKGVTYEWAKAQYSINQGLWGTSVGGKETLNSWDTLPEEAWPTQLTATGTEEVIIEFEQGEPIAINGTRYEHPVAAIQALQAIASPYAVGRDVHVGDTIIGIKGRVGFEAAAPLILIKAHHLLEKHVLTKFQQHWKKQLADSYGMMLHEAQFLEPVMRNIEGFLTDTQESVTGKVRVRLSPYQFQAIGVQSEYDMMSAKFGTYGEMNRAWSGDDVKGFTKILGMQGKLHRLVNEE
ncbi:MAG: argininosuccinate synthase [Bacteroidia bacterium]|nr:argininosuccinate synthase [Bacteroidia bacterium]